MEIIENKERFLNLLKGTKRDGIDNVIAMLLKSDFFEAPASTRFHGSYPGGLCEHCLGVYDAAEKLCKEFMSETDEASIRLVALLHDVCKMNLYQLGTRNVKNETTGQWEKVPTYKFNDEEPYGHGEKSVLKLLRAGLALSDEEIYAIRWHMGFSDKTCQGGDMGSFTASCEKYPLVCIAHLADMAECYLKPKK